MRRRLTGFPLKLTVAAAYLLSAILFNGLQLAWMGLGDAASVPMAHAMPADMPCEGGDHHAPGQPHCPVCLVAVSPGLVAAAPLLAPPRTAQIGVAETTAAVPAAPALPRSPQRARAPPRPSFA